MQSLPTSATLQYNRNLIEVVFYFFIFLNLHMHIYEIKKQDFLRD